MAKKTFSPMTLKTTLIFLLVVVILGGAGLFYLGLNSVKEFSAEVTQSAHEADESGKQIEQLQALKSRLSSSESLISNADKLFSTPETYQAQSLADLKNYAKQVGLTISSANFDDPSTGSYAVTITLREPVSYTKLIQFLTLVEGNLPKLQVASIELGHMAGGGSDDVKVGAIKINVSVR